MKEQNSGFTLIELLVVVLIIGVLAAVALPQYNKAVWRSRNAGIKKIIKTVAQAQQAYYLEHGQYAANFNELDIDLPLTPVRSNGSESQYVVSGPCQLATMGPDAIRRGDRFDIVLNQTSLSGGSVIGVWIDGPYKCRGFKFSSQTGKLTCLEHNRVFSASFCEPIEGGISLSEGNASNWHSYTLP